MQRPLSAAFWIELLLSIISAFLTALTIVWPHWIEGVFEVDPDSGTGSSEWGITLVFIVITVTLAAWARRTWRRDRHGPGFHVS